jgi:hypothetical protein
MPSTSAGFAALASVLVGLHQSGFLGEPGQASSGTAAPAGEHRECRLYDDVSLNLFREKIFVLILSPRHELEIACCALSILSFVGALAVLGRCRRCFGGCRRGRVTAVQLVFQDGSEGVDRRIARRRLTPGAAR